MVLDQAHIFILLWNDWPLNMLKLTSDYVIDLG